MERTSNLLILAGLLISIATLNSCKKEDKNLPSLITIPASGITTSTAILGGIVGDDGGAAITSRGVCWGTEPDPVISGLNKNIIGAGTGFFKCTLIGLIPNTLYYVRAYAMNSEGTAYGGEVKFTTMPAKAPVVETIIEYVDYYGAGVKIIIKNDGGAPVTEKGICWATTENPTIVDNDKKICNDIGTCYAGPLKPKSSYHVRAYANNGVGISYGNDEAFTTLVVPEVTTYPATGITDSSATAGGKVILVGDVYDFETGICYGRGKDPAINGLHIQADISDSGEFTCKLVDLNPGTLYYARAYIIWPKDYFWEVYVVYGNEVSFTTH